MCHVVRAQYKGILTTTTQYALFRRPIKFAFDYRNLEGLNDEKQRSRVCLQSILLLDRLLLGSVDSVIFKQLPCFQLFIAFGANEKKMSLRRENDEGPWDYRRPLPSDRRTRLSEQPAKERKVGHGSSHAFTPALFPCLFALSRFPVYLPFCAQSSV